MEVLRSILESQRDEFTEDNNISSVRLMRGRCHRIIADKTLDTISEKFGREYVVRTYDGALMVTRKHYTGNKFADGWHFWLEFKGLHFDSECTDGVPSPEELPRMRRNDCSNPLSYESIK